MRKMLLAALLCAAATAFVPDAKAQALAMAPSADGAMLIPTHVDAHATLIPAQYRGYRHYRRHYRPRRHYR